MNIQGNQPNAGYYANRRMKFSFNFLFLTVGNIQKKVV